MSQQITHEAERERQHARYRIPISVGIHDRIYQVRDWSVGGFSVEGTPPKIQGKIFHPVFVFRFDAMSVHLKLSAELIWQNSKGAGFRFQDLNSQQLSVLRYI